MTAAVSREAEAWQWLALWQLLGHFTTTPLTAPAARSSLITCRRPPHQAHLQREQPRVQLLRHHLVLVQLARLEQRREARLGRRDGVLVPTAGGEGGGAEGGAGMGLRGLHLNQAMRAQAAQARDSTIGKP
jgi:hypothetical protein